MKRIISIILLVLLILSLMVTPAAAANEGQQYSADKNALLSSLYEAGISDIREAIALGLITSEEITTYYLERIDEYNKAYNCFITLCDDAVETAKERDRQLAEGKGEGLLFGVPVAIKDNMDLAGYYTTGGKALSDSFIADESADVVELLLSEGAVIVGKTNMSTNAQEARQSYSKAVGHTYNAYSTHMASGGSSGGSAVAVSLNFAAAALGTDTNSSLRYPAALNGCVSLRPTYKLISTRGCTPLNASRDTVGAITRTVYDQAVMLDVLTGGEYGFTENLNGDALSGLRIGIISELSYATRLEKARTEANIDDEIELAFSTAVSEFKRLGARVQEVSMPDIFKLSKNTFNTGGTSAKNKLYNAFCSMMEQYDLDVAVFPTYLSTPMRVGTDEQGKYWSVFGQTYINNCKILSPSTGLPEISVPIGRHSLGAGIGMEIVSFKNSEQLLLDVAYTYTAAYDHRIQPSGAPDSYAGYHTLSLKEIIDECKEFYKDQSKTEQPEKTDKSEEEAAPAGSKPSSSTAQTVSANASSQDLSAREQNDATALPWQFTALIVCFIAVALCIVGVVILYVKTKKKTNPHP